MTYDKPKIITGAVNRVEIAIAAAGVGLIACAMLARQPWLDRHFLPSWFLPHHWYVAIESLVRTAMAAVGLVLALVMRRWLARVIVVSRESFVLSVVGVVLAFGLSELVLRHIHLRASEWLVADEEPRRRHDARLGWTFEPARTGHSRIGGRRVEYAFDRAGYRVRHIDEPVDPQQPAILFIGESVMFGEGLAWEETIPAQVGAMTGVQSANLAVHGFSSDQSYLRLQTELPHFQHPVAVVSLFMTALFGRNLDQDRPHLGPGLAWLPAKPSSRVASLAALLVPYRADATVERGIAVTRELLRETVALARARNATPLVVVPQFGPEDPAERALRQRILDDTIPSVIVTIDDAWRLPWDRHPNARAARTIAAAIAERLRR